MGIEQWWNGDYQGECDNVLPDRGYRWAGSNSGMLLRSGKQKDRRRNSPLCYFAENEIHVKSPGIELETPFFQFTCNWQ